MSVHDHWAVHVAQHDIGEAVVLDDSRTARRLVRAFALVPEVGGESPPRQLVHTYESTTLVGGVKRLAELNPVTAGGTCSGTGDMVMGIRRQPSQSWRSNYHDPAKLNALTAARFSDRRTSAMD